MILHNRHRKLLLRLIEEHLPSIVDVIVYGSRADGTAHDMSDLDLALRSRDDKIIDYNILIEFKTAVRKSNLPMLVDVFDWKRLPESFIPQIERCGINLERNADLEVAAH